LVVEAMSGEVAGALGSLGSDLAFTVSFVTARELLEAGTDSGLRDEEIIAAILALSIVLSSLPKTAAVLMPAGIGGDGILAFFQTIVGLSQRIVISLSVQLLAASVRSKTEVRSVRVLSLLSVSVFFLFLEAAANSTTRKSSDGSL